jgi:ribosomal protein S16
MNNFASQSSPQAMENAADIIERFGGIRPMASKIGVAVTTIQGWKKRGVIPANRVAAVLAAAAAQGIKIEDIIVTAEKSDAAQAAVEMVSDSVGPLMMGAPANAPSSLPPPSVPSHEERYEQIKVQQASIREADKPKPKQYAELVIEDKNKGIPKTTYAVFAVLILVGAAVIGLLMPKNKNQGDEVANLGRYV